MLIKFSIINDEWAMFHQVCCFHVDILVESNFIFKDSSPDPDPTLTHTVSIVSESQLNASLDVERPAGESVVLTTSQRMNGTYANFTTYNHARSSTVVSPENGKLKLKQFVTNVN